MRRTSSTWTCLTWRWSTRWMGCTRRASLARRWTRSTTATIVARLLHTTHIKDDICTWMFGEVILSNINCHVRLHRLWQCRNGDRYNPIITLSFSSGTVDWKLLHHRHRTVFGSKGNSCFTIFNCNFSRWLHVSLHHWISSCTWLVDIIINRISAVLQDVFVRCCVWFWWRTRWIVIITCCTSECGVHVQSNIWVITMFCTHWYTSEWL